MKNKPLSSNDQSKLLIFILMLLPSVVMGVGVIPALFLGFGVFMLKKHEDFSHIETAVRNSRVYILLMLVGCIVTGLYAGGVYFTWQRGLVELVICMVLSVIAIIYLVVMKTLFLDPLLSHSEWVEVNGIFSSKPKATSAKCEESKIDIIKSERLRSYSVADELAKWIKLKDDGHISEEEYNEARKNLLQRT